MGVSVNTRRARDAIKDWLGVFEREDILNKVKDEFENWIDKNFTTQGGKVGGWKPFSPNTLVHPERRGPLLRKGNLRRSFNVNVTGNSIEIKSRSQVAEWIQEGTRSHTITPTQEKVLKFNTIRGPVSTQQVEHPGTPARQLIPTKKQAKEIATDEIKRFKKEAKAKAR